MRQNVSLVFKLGQLIVIFALLFSYAMFQGGFVSWFLFYSFLPLLIYMGIMLFYPVSKWSVTRKLSHDRMEASGEVSVDIHIRRKFSFPIYYCIVEEFFPSSLQKRDITQEKYRHMDQLNQLVINRKVKQVAFPWFKRHIHYSYTLKDVPRGEHHLKAIRVRVGDFLGFVKRDYVFEVENKLLVYPAYRDLVLNEQLSNGQASTATAANRVNAKNTTMVTGVREYMPGDRFSWIDWKTTARKNTVMTKEFEQEKSTETLLIFDGVDYSNLNELAFEATIELTNSLIESFRHQRSDLAFLSVGKDTMFFPRLRDAGQILALRKFLAQTQPSGDIIFAQHFAQQVKRTADGSNLIVVTSQLNEQLKQAIQQEKVRRKNINLFIITPSSALTEQDRMVISQLDLVGVKVNVLTEKHLIKQEFEVNLS